MGLKDVVVADIKFEETARVRDSKIETEREKRGVWVLFVMINMENNNFTFISTIKLVPDHFSSYRLN